MASASYFRILLRENRRTFFLALPIVAGLVGQMLIGIADTIMVGRVGVTPLAACALCRIGIDCRKKKSVMIPMTR